MEKITRWMFILAVAILVVYSLWRFSSVNLQLREAETLLEGLRQEERILFPGPAGEEREGGAAETTRETPVPGREEWMNSSAAIRRNGILFEKRERRT